jgi:hypothetical protein
VVGGQLSGIESISQALKKQGIKINAPPGQTHFFRQQFGQS